MMVALVTAWGIIVFLPYLDVNTQGASGKASDNCSHTMLCQMGENPLCRGFVNILVL